MLSRAVANVVLRLLESVTSGTTRKAIAVPHVAYNLANAVDDVQKGNAVGLLLNLIGLVAAVSRLLG
mgnify:CR=1 FL=1